MCGAEDRAIAAEHDGHVGIDRRDVAGAVKSAATTSTHARDSAVAAAGPRRRRSAAAPAPLSSTARKGRSAGAGICTWMRLHGDQRVRSNPRFETSAIRTTANVKWRCGYNIRRAMATSMTIAAWRRSRSGAGQLAADAAMPWRVEPQIGQQFVAVAMFDEPVGDAQAADAAGVQPGVAGGFQHRAAETAHQAPSSTVTTKATLADRARRIVSRSSGLTKRALITPMSSPSLGQHVGRLRSQALQQRAAGDDRAVASPSGALRPCPVPAGAGSRVDRSRPRPWDSGWPRDRRSSRASSIIAGRSCSSPGAMTTRFGSGRK